MSRDNESAKGEHVKFIKYDYRPYVEPIDLVKSENFQRIVRRAAEKRREALKQREG